MPFCNKRLTAIQHLSWDIGNRDKYEEGDLDVRTLKNMRGIHVY